MKKLIATLSVCFALVIAGHAFAQDFDEPESQEAAQDDMATSHADHFRHVLEHIHNHIRNFFHGNEGSESEMTHEEHRTHARDHIHSRLRGLLHGEDRNADENESN
ncbi:MAG: hypothetical protein NUW37_13455 [Planctomycetes bacterium]|nr:hypothetical protein [Planctomycetota bacterium]